MKGTRNNKLSAKLFEFKIQKNKMFILLNDRQPNITNTSFHKERNMKQKRKPKKNCCTIQNK